jgi:hypothetical protein
VVNLSRTMILQEINRFEVRKKKNKNGPAEPVWTDPRWVGPDPIEAPNRYRFVTSSPSTNWPGTAAGATLATLGSSGGSPGGTGGRRRWSGEVEAGWCRAAEVSWVRARALGLHADGPA